MPDSYRLKGHPVFGKEISWPSEHTWMTNENNYFIFMYVHKILITTTVLVLSFWCKNLRYLKTDKWFWTIYICLIIPRLFVKLNAWSKEEYDFGVSTWLDKYIYKDRLISQRKMKHKPDWSWYIQLICGLGIILLYLLMTKWLTQIFDSGWLYTKTS